MEALDAYEVPEWMRSLRHRDGKDLIDRARVFLLQQGFKLLERNDVFDPKTDEILSGGLEWKQTGGLALGNLINKDYFICRRPFTVKQGDISVEKPEGRKESEGDRLMDFFFGK